MCSNVLILFCRREFSWLLVYLYYAGVNVDYALNIFIIWTEYYTVTVRHLHQILNWKRVCVKPLLSSFCYCLLRWTIYILYVYHNNYTQNKKNIKSERGGIRAELLYDYALYFGKKYSFVLDCLLKTIFFCFE